MNVTLDSITCDRNVMLLFLTLEKEGGFNLGATSFYEGSQENDWSRAHMLAPVFSYSLASNGQSLGEGSVQTLDAYEEDGKIKVMQRIVPNSVLPDHADVTIRGVNTWDEQTQPQEASLSAGLDLTSVTRPRSISDKQLTFATSQGEKAMTVHRFTVSELGCIMIAGPGATDAGSKSGDSAEPDSATIAESNGAENAADKATAKGAADSESDTSALTPEQVIVADSEGNVLTPFATANEVGYTAGNARIIEFAGISPSAASVTFTPLASRDFSTMTVEERRAFNEQSKRTVDLASPGADLPTSEYGGYTLTERTVADRTVTFRLKPYGWTGSIELMPQDDVTMLASTWTDPETGESGTGYHSAITWQRRDPLTGELLIMNSYYAATDEELQGLTEYTYPTSFDCYTKEDSAAQTVSF